MTDWSAFSFQVNVDFLGFPSEGAEPFDSTGVRNITEMAQLDARLACKWDTPLLKHLFSVLTHRLPPEGEPVWASDLLAKFGFTGNPSSGPPRVPSARSSPPGPGHKESHVVARVNAPPGLELAWSTLLAAVSAHFNADGLIAIPANAETSSLYVKVPIAQWENVAAGRASWSIPVGLGAEILLATQRKDGKPFNDIVPTKLSYRDVHHSVKRPAPFRPGAPPAQRARTGASFEADAVNFRPRHNQSMHHPSSSPAEQHSWADSFSSRSQPYPTDSAHQPPSLARDPSLSDMPPSLAPPHSAVLPTISNPQASAPSFAPPFPPPQPFPTVSFTPTNPGQSSPTAWQAFIARQESGSRGPGNLWLPGCLPSQSVIPPIVLLVTWAVKLKFPSLPSLSLAKGVLGEIISQLTHEPISNESPVELLSSDRSLSPGFWCCLSCGLLHSLGQTADFCCFSCSRGDSLNIPVSHLPPPFPELQRTVCSLLGCDADALHAINFAAWLPAFQLVEAWLGRLCSMAHQLKPDDGISPPMLLGGEPIVWVVKDPVWLDIKQDPKNSIPWYFNSSLSSSPCYLGFLSRTKLPDMLSRVISAAGTQCTWCLRPTAASVSLNIQSSIASCPHFAGLCPCSRESLPVTQGLVARTRSEFGGIPLPGVVLFPSQRMFLCAPSAPPRPLLFLDQDTEFISRPSDSIRSDHHAECDITILTLNCGGASSKVPNIIALAIQSQATVIFLQEVWEAFQIDAFDGSPYRAFTDGVFRRGGGLVTLLHSDFLDFSLRRGRISTSSVEGFLDLACLLRNGTHLHLINLYLRPGIPTEEWVPIKSIVQGLASIRPEPRVIIAGDFNEQLAKSPPGRVQRSLKSNGPWAFLHVPYPLGNPTNFVLRNGRATETEIDYILMDKRSPWILSQKSVTPGVSTHAALCLTLSAPPGAFVNKNPASKKLDFKNATAGILSHLAGTLNLLLWLHPSDPVDAVISRFHDLAKQALPRRVAVPTVSPSALIRALELQASSGDCLASVRLEAVRQSLCDRACIKQLGLRSSLVHQTALNAVNSKPFKIKVRSFEAIHEVSLDGIHFPTDATEFKDVARSQAMSFYLAPEQNLFHFVADCARQYISTVRDDLCMQDFVESHRRPPPTSHHVFPSSDVIPLVSSTPICDSISGSELAEQALKNGSDACSMDEIPPSVLRSLSAFSWGCISSWLAACHEGAPSFFLSSALHLCLRKREPYWDLRNSRPIILEPPLRRLEAGAMFRRLMSQGEQRGWIDSWFFSYRKEISPLLLGLFCRWCIAFWVVTVKELWVADWDESNAFCNIPRDVLGTLMKDTPDLDCTSWLSSFFGSMQVFLQTPFGLANPYKLKQGGVQGDSMGVGQYVLIRLLRSKAFRVLATGPAHPSIPTEFVPEVVFSDDSRIFATSRARMEENLDLARSIASCVGGKANTQKIRVFRLCVNEKGLGYHRGSISCTLGDMACALGGLAIVGIPCIMGESSRAHFLQVEKALRICLARLRRLLPTAILALRVVTAFAVSKADYRLAVTPSSQKEAFYAQRLVQQCARAMLQVPNWFPSLFLRLPHSHGGLGFPSLYERLRMRRLLLTTLAASSRNAYVRSLVQVQCSNPLWDSLRWSDVFHFRKDFESLDLKLVCEPKSHFQPPQVHGIWRREPSSGPVVVVTDGSCQGNQVGYAAVFFDNGGALGSFYSNACFADASSWVAEWLGKILGLVCLLPYPGTSVVFISDNISVAAQGHIYKASGSHFVDACIRFFLAQCKSRCVVEGFTPAEHDLKWPTTVARMQAEADALSKTARGLWNPPSCVPFLEHLTVHSLLLKGGLVYLKPGECFESLYEHVVSSAMPKDIILPLPAKAWERVVTGALVSNSSLALALWLRSSTLIQFAPASAYCPYCLRSAVGWVDHLRNRCPIVPAACSFAFRVALASLEAIGWELEFHFIGRRPLL